MEIGQIIFVIAALAIFSVVKIFVASLHKMTFSEVLSSIQRPSGYIVGTLAMFWTIECVALFWHGRYSCYCLPFFSSRMEISSIT